MGLIVLLAAASIVWWAWTKGHVKALRSADLAAVAALFVGIFLLGKGQPLPGVVLLAGAGWWGWRRRNPALPSMSRIEASRLLEVPIDATPDQVRAAHRRIVARVHPDVGGSAELASRVNAARDALLGR